MSDLLKIEIAIVAGDNRNWQWLGKLSPKSLLILTKMADSMSDSDVEAQDETNQTMPKAKCTRVFNDGGTHIAQVINGVICCLSCKKPVSEHKHRYA